MLVMYDDEKVENKGFAFDLCIVFCKMSESGMSSGLQLIINSQLTDNWLTDNCPKM